MKKILFSEMSTKIKELDFENFDLVIAIGRGGLVPAALIAEQLNVQMHTLWLKFKEDSKPGSLIIGAGPTP